MHSNPSFFKVLPVSKESSAWVSPREMAIMASQTVGKAMHCQSLDFEVILKSGLEERSALESPRVMAIMAS